MSVILCANKEHGTLLHVYTWHAAHVHSHDTIAQGVPDFQSIVFFFNEFLGLLKVKLYFAL